jgi:hypothetical protein
MKKTQIRRDAKTGRIVSGKIAGFGALKGTVKVTRVDITKPISTQSGKAPRAAKK